MEREIIVQEEFERLISEGYLCGPASLMALAKAYEIPLCNEVICQSELFTKGGGVYDRCAFFQSAAVMIGLCLGRTLPTVDRRRYRDAMQILSDTFIKNHNGYRCKQLANCEKDKEITHKLLHTTVEALEKIGIKGKNDFRNN